MPDWSTLLVKLAEATGESFPLSRTWPVGGGCINEATVLEGAGTRYFVKHSRSSSLDMFIAEAQGLDALRATGAVRVPTPVCWGADAHMAFIVLEYLDISTLRPATEETFGRQLAALHRTTQRQFGWHRDNTIGSTRQPNAYTPAWVEFLRDRRLGFQLDLAAGNGHGRLLAKGERLLAHLEAFFGDYVPQASLLHGDLWSGNAGEIAAGEPVIFDPAVYFGDREADLAMTRLFGGFSESFYRAYMEAWPLAPGHELRTTLYNLYHVLNHLNLFGGGYAARAKDMLDRLLAEIR